MMPTTERLAIALIADKAPDWMVQKARDGYYDDFKSELATPTIQLVHDLNGAGLRDLADRVMNGMFDSTKEESEDWVKSPDGQGVIKKLMEGK